MAIDISSTTRRIVYTGSAGTGPYTFNFEVLSQTDIAVYFNYTELTLTTDYTVTVDPDGTGSVTIVTGTNVPTTPDADDRITIVGDRTIERSTDFTTGGPLFATSLNDEFDSQTIFVQQVQEQADRALRAPNTDPTNIDMTLPNNVDRANKTLAFDSDGNPIIGEQIGDWKGDWAASTSYNKRDLVKDTTTDNVYICIVAHTSSGALPITTNTDSAKWDLVVDAAAAATAQAAAEAAQAAAEAAQAAAELAETNAETAETNAETAETNAEAAQAAAELAQTGAETAETNAETAQSAAEAAQAAAEAVLDNFDDAYLGAKASDPTVDNDGDPLADGALYFDTTNDIMKVYDLATTTWFQLTPTVLAQTNINTVAGIASDVSAVAAIDSDVTTVAGIDSDVSTVAADSADISTVATSIANVNTTATNITNVNTTATNIANVNTVAGISADVTSVAGISANVTTVAGITSDVAAVGAIASDVTTVAGVATDVTTAATNIVDISNFADVYYGPSATAPTLRADGSALQIGDLYFDTATDTMKVYGSGGWVAAGSSVNGTADRFVYSVSSSTTTITGPDDDANTLAYDAGYVDVYLNGVKMVEGSDVTSTSGTSIVFATAIGTSGTDTVDIIAYGTFSLASFSVGDANDVSLGGVATNDLLQYSGSAFIPKSFDEVTPDQTGNSGKYLTTDGTNSSWGTIDTDPTMGGDLSGTAFNAQIVAGSVDTTELADGAVTSAKLDTNISVPGTVTATSFSGDGSSLTGIAGGFSNMDVFTSPGTWTNPGTVTKVKVTVLGAGGGGGSTSTVNFTASGGGAGGLSYDIVSSPTPISPVAVTVGSGGSAGSAGGTSSFGAYCSATGGGGGSSSPSPQPRVATLPYSQSGLGSGGLLNTYQEDGGTDVINISNTYTGSGGNSIFGKGGAGKYVSTPGGIPAPEKAGRPGQGYGSGGSGGTNGNTPAPAGIGGTGAPGIVIVEY